MSSTKAHEAMTRALSRHDGPVDVRRPEDLERWHKIAGLVCLICAKDVHVYKRGKRAFIRHTADPKNDQRCAAAATGPERYEHELLKFWVRDRLRGLGFQAECEQRVNRSQPDVRAAGFGRQLAVEVQLGHLSDEEVEARTAKLLAEDHEVLWLTRHCNWVQQQPAVNVRALERAVDDSTLIGESYYLAREGVLRPDSSGELVAGQRDVALGTLIDLFARGRIGWAMLRHEQYGWAVTEDWQRHLERQGRRVADLEQQLQQARAAQSRLEAAHVEQGRELTGSRSAVAAAQAQLQGEQAQTQAITEQLEAMRNERDNATQLAEQRETRLQDLQAQLSRTFWGKRVLRRVDPQ